MTEYQYNLPLNTLKKGVKLFLSASMYKKLFDNSYNRFPLSVRKNHSLISQSFDSMELNYDYNVNLFNLKDVSKCIKNSNFILESLIANLYVDFNEDDEDENFIANIFNEQLQELLNGHFEIPYNIEKRKELFSWAF
jgi:hypothetical protein